MVLVFVLVALVLGGCGNGGSSRRVFSDDQSGAEIELRAGDQFQLELTSNPSTGFGWTLDAAGLPDAVSLVDDGYEPPRADVVGAAGIQWFTFEAVRRGAGVIRLEYIRPFDDPPIPDRVAEYIVMVDGAIWPPGDPGPAPGTSVTLAPP